MVSDFLHVSFDHLFYFDGVDFAAFSVANLHFYKI